MDLYTEKALDPISFLGQSARIWHGLQIFSKEQILKIPFRAQVTGQSPWQLLCCAWTNSLDLSVSLHSVEPLICWQVCLSMSYGWNPGFFPFQNYPPVSSNLAGWNIFWTKWSLNGIELINKWGIFHTQLCLHSYPLLFKKNASLVDMSRK